PSPSDPSRASAVVGRNLARIRLGALLRFNWRSGPRLPERDPAAADAAPVRRRKEVSDANPSMAACSMDKLISVTQVRGARQCADGWPGVETLHEISPHSIVQTMILVRHNGWGIEGLHSFRAR